MNAKREPSASGFSERHSRLLMFRYQRVVLSGFDANSATSPRRRRISISARPVAWACVGGFPHGQGSRVDRLWNQASMEPRSCSGTAAFRAKMPDYDFGSVSLTWATNRRAVEGGR